MKYDTDYLMNFRLMNYDLWVKYLKDSFDMTEEEYQKKVLN
jgi:hypothetical protein